MKTLKQCLYLCVVLLALSAAASAQSDFYLKNGDRVVFYGDSITDQRLYTTFVETYVLTRFPGLNVSFVHSGWGGDRVGGGGGGKIDVRLQRDVIAYQPTVMTVMLGMNDARYRAWDQKIFDEYATGYESIVKTMKAAFPKLRMTLIQPSPYDDVTQPPKFEGGYNAVLIRYGEFVKELAKREGLDMADLNTSVVAALKRAGEIDATGAQKIIPDRIHPGAGGHLLMAEALLRAWKAPSLVTAVEIDASKGKVVRADNTKATGLGGEGAIWWMQTDSALPMPLDLNDALLALAVRSSKVVENLNQQSLKITGLTGPRYALKIDGEEVGAFTKEQLAEGLNLATLPTPMTRQAAAVHALTLKHNNVHFTRWRSVQVPLEKDAPAQARKAMEALDELEAELIRQQRAAAQPKPHRYELIPQM
ncbi:MAG TPA: SGNH/GDSL hydrolase family protein [Blastocatellia bacterium]|nr:SGNH/GDSL hydrolase family protein [Blastocatellia bacterium]